jgi:Ca2+-binding RTX toxin-like protein
MAVGVAGTGLFAAASPAGATPTTSWDSGTGTYTVTGDGTSEVISVSCTGAPTDPVRVTGVTQSTPPTCSQIVNLVVNAGDGNDTVPLAGLESPSFQSLASIAANGQLGDDSVLGGGRGETLTGGEGSDILTGQGGDDSVDAGAGDDFGPVRGDAGNDTILGGAGTDGLTIGQGDDTVGGGTEADIYVFEAAGLPETDVLVEAAGGGIGDRLSFSGSDPVTINLSNTSNESLGSQGARTIIVQTTGQQGNFESVVGGAGNDSLTGDASNEGFFGEAGNDTLSTGAGSDLMAGGLGDDSIDGGTDPDLIQDGPFTLHTVLTDTRLTNTLTAGLGADTLAGIEAADLFGDENSNLISALTFSGTVTLSGQAGDDQLLGGQGADSVRGGEGNDEMRGWLGTDTVDGGAGSNDRLVDTPTDFPVSLTPTTYTTPTDTDDLLGIEAAVIGGHGGDNAMDASAFTGPVTLFGDAGNDTLIGGSAADSLDGSAGVDSLGGGPGADQLLGRSENDRIRGDGGRDGLFGGGGGDRLQAKDGIRDTVNGGTGTDTARVDGKDVVRGVEQRT